MGKRTTSERLKELMEEKEIKQVDILNRCQPYCSQFGVKLSKSDLSQYISGKVIPRQDKLTVLACALDVSEAWLMGYDVPKGRQSATPESPTISLFAYPNIYDVDVQRVPMLGSVSCGVPKFANMEYESYTLKGTGIKCDFCLRASGDSMIGIGIHDGDIVFCRQQAMVDNGDVAVVAIGDEATLKRFYYYKEQCMLILRPENPAYPELVYSGSELDEVHVLGKAVASQMDVK